MIRMFQKDYGIFTDTILPESIMHCFRNGNAAVIGILSSFEYTGIPGLECQSGAVRTYIRSGFKDNADDTDGSACFFQVNTTGKNTVFQYHMQRIRQ